MYMDRLKLRAEIEQRAHDRDSERAGAAGDHDMPAAKVHYPRPRFSRIGRT